jgi:hypothetical protein
MKELHPKIEEVLKFPSHGTVIDGVFASEAIDTSGEMIDIKEMDITSLNDGSGVANTEHINPEDKQFKEAKAEDAGQWAVIVGRVIFAKKIFSEDDCTSERELAFWNEVKLPFIYGAVELFDSDGHHNAQELAATIWHYHKRKLPVVARYSIEGSTVDRDGHILRPTIARRVAITIKPCNQAAASSLVERTNVPPKHFKKDKELSKIEQIGTFETESFPLVFSSTTDDLFGAVSDLKKAFELGGGDVAPSARTGMAALASETTPEHQEKKRKKNELKYRLMAAMRDWNRMTPIKEHLKHELRDVHDSFIDKFSEMAEEIVLSKKEVEYKGNMVRPGEAMILAGPFAGSSLPILHLDEKHAHVQSFKSGGQEAAIINKLSTATLGSHWAIITHPKLSSKPNLPEDVKDLNRLPAQTLLLYHLDLNNKIVTKTSTHGDDGAGWYLNGMSKHVFAKPEIESVHDDVKNLSTAQREVIFYLASEEFFGLGRSVPVTALVKNTKTEKLMSVIEKFDGSHFFSSRPDATGVRTVKQAGNSGILEKMAIMDVIMGNCDRTKLNYMVNGEQVALIDNSFIFNFRDEIIPAYILDYAHLIGRKLSEILLKQETIDWLGSLDAFKLKEYLESLGVPEEFATESSKRLLSMQSCLFKTKLDLNSILMSHFSFVNPVKPNEEANI